MNLTQGPGENREVKLIWGRMSHKLCGGEHKVEEELGGNEVLYESRWLYYGSLQRHKEIVVIGKHYKYLSEL